MHKIKDSMPFLLFFPLVVEISISQPAFQNSKLTSFLSPS